MGLFDGFRSLLDPIPVSPVVKRAEGDTDALLEAIADEVAARQLSFTLTQALQLPPVIRGRSLIGGVAASMVPTIYRGGVAQPEPPRIVRKPDPFGTRYQFIRQTVDAMVATRHGEAFWLLSDHDERGYPRSAMVLPNDEVRVQWDARRFLPRYWWRDRELVRDIDIKHIAPNREPGELHGKGPIQESLSYLYPIAMAEEYASSFFSSGGLPMTVIKTAAKLTEEEAVLLKQQYIAGRDEGESGVGVAGGGMELDFPNTDPQKSQMQEARGAGAAIVARILGIPAALLQVETSGATITYTNPAGALEELVKSTIVPLYLTPLEQAWSELVPATQAVRFELTDLARADISARFAIYAQGIASGVMTAEEARAYEGWGPSPVEAAQAFTPEPAPVPVSIEVPT